MKHMKSIISLIVALCVVATCAVSAFASEDDSSSSSEAAPTSIVTDLTDGKIVKFDTFNKIKYDDAEFTGDTDAIADNGLLYANDDETNKITLSPALDLGKTWQATATFARTNEDKDAKKNCLGEKFELNVGKFSFRIGNQQAGVAQYKAELWFDDQLLGDVQVTGDISGTYAIRYTQDGTEKGRVYVIKDNQNMRWNVLESTCAPNEAINGVTSFFVVDGVTEGETSEVSVVAAGNNSKDDTNYAYGLWLAKKFYSTNRTGDGTTGATGTTSTAGGNSGKTGDMTLPIVFVVVALVAAGTGVVLTSKKTCKE